MTTHVRRKEALEYHTRGRPGKVAVVPTKPLTTQRDLALAYSPGVAEPCIDIAKEPADAYKYTARGNLVAVISNGTAVLGLGNIGALASKPVMEGKGVLFKKFADIDVFDLEIDATDPEKFVECVAALEPTFGGINLEDIKSPECFYIEDELKKRMRIPVFHDDQHGTAIISGAALLNAAEIQEKKLGDLRVVVSGAGASAIACARFYCSLGVDRSKITMVDSTGVIYRGRTERMNALKEEFAVETKARTLAEAMDGADVFLGLSVGGLVKADMVRKMADRPIVFALANPDPEISPEDAKKARPDAIVATGRSDYNNQVNNVLGFPFLFRGALDVQATTINEAMKVAAAQALADLARKDVPQSVAQAYGEEYTFGPEYIIPKPLDPRVALWVSPAVAQAAVESGVAKGPVDLDAYREQLHVRVGGTTPFMRKFVRRATASPQRIVFPEAYDPRILRACSILVDEGIVKPVLIGRPEILQATCKEHDIDLDIEKVETRHPRTDERYEAFVDEFHRRRKRKGVDINLARVMMRERIHFGMMMVAMGEADGAVAGVNFSYPDTVRPALQVVGLAPGVRRTAGMYVMIHPRGPLFLGDTTVNAETSPEILADVAEMVADAARSYDVTPRVAMLSFANFGSARNPRAKMVAEATEILRSRRPDLEVEGEIQANVALDFELQKRRFGFSRLTGPANVLIFPNLEAGNIAYKLMRELGGVPAVGPVLLGMDRPVTVLERDAPVDNIVQMAALTAVQAQDLQAKAGTGE